MYPSWYFSDMGNGLNQSYLWTSLVLAFWKEKKSFLIALPSAEEREAAVVIIDEK